MALIEMAGTQVVILRSYTTLGSSDDLQRHRAMTTLYECGDAARWCLQLAIRQNGQPRVQFGAAVVLHWLGDRQGLITLTEALKWRLPTEPLIAPHLDSAFITIGSPDAVDALLTVWKMLPDWGEHEPMRAAICRVWSALRNPSVLPSLAESALLNPARFEQTVPAFGEMAIPILKAMSRSADSKRRALAVQTLRHIPGPNAFSVLLPLLQDSDPYLRALVPAALARTGNRLTAVSEIADAVRKGYPSVEAIQFLNQSRPDGYAEVLTSLFETWTPQRGEELGLEIVSAALPPLVVTALDVPRTQLALCRLLDQPVGPQVAVTVIAGLETLTGRSPKLDPGVTSCLTNQLSSPIAHVRHRAASALARLGYTFPAYVLEFLEQCKPQDSLVTQLQVILRGGRDAGQAATQAVEQVSKWWTKLTSDSASPQPGAPNLRHTGTGTAAVDPRLPAMLCQMLANSLRRNTAAQTFEDLEEKAAFIVSLLRALARLGLPAAQSAWQDIITLLHLPSEFFCIPGRPSSTICYLTVATAASETIIGLYGANSFVLFLETLYSPRMEVVKTGITALGALGDSRGLPPLRAISANEAHPCSEFAHAAIAQIKRTNPEMMSLLRGSSPAGSDPAVLLRAAGSSSSVNSGELLRAVPDLADTP